MNAAQKARLDELRNRFILHKGHLIQYVSNGHRNNFGTLERITLDDEYVSLKLWLKYPLQELSFSVQVQAEMQGQAFFNIYIDQFVGCYECKQKEGKPTGAKSETGASIDPSRISVRGKV